jgi:hypothetical protein
MKRFKYLPGRYYDLLPRLCKGRFAVVRIQKSNCEIIASDGSISLDSGLANMVYEDAKRESSSDCFIAIVNHKMKFRASTFGRKQPEAWPKPKPPLSANPAAA